MTINHIDQLAQWYADAEQITKTNLPRKGDTLIYPRRTSGYIIESDDGGWAPEVVSSTGETVRILARAPKPAWHDARAVIAHVNDLRGAHRRVFVRRGEVFGGVRWEDEISSWPSAELRDVTPLIEAKVTDEMVSRVREARDASGRMYFGSRLAAYELLTAALGLETE